jgi:hypothetical protein
VNDEQFQELVSMIKVLETKMRFLEMDLADINQKLDLMVQQPNMVDTTPRTTIVEKF